MSAAPSPEPEEPDAPGVPGFRTWRGVYLFVFACFVAMVIALTFFARYYG
ncbi:MAG: hypothetical protein JNK23_21020 [Opitutaceae bacterium]|nr:hypothetical protein [Opitutaceae bacterium]